MGSNHKRANHDHQHAHGSTGNLRTAFLLNLTFTVIEVIGGFWTNSIAILSDAVHDFGDSISLGLAWYFDKLSKKGRTAQHTYGYRRYSLLGGLITGVVLITGLGFVLWHAVQRLFAPEAVNAPGMMILAAVGIAFNGAAVLKVRRGTSLTEQVVSWHLLEDTLGWAAVFIGAAAMTVWDVPILDPLLSIAISLFVLWNVMRNLRKVFNVFIQEAPADFDLEAFERAVLRNPQVLSMHHTHSWSIDGESHVLTTHLVMRRDARREHIKDAKDEVRRLLDRNSFEHVTIDVELEDEACVLNHAKEGQDESADHRH